MVFECLKSATLFQLDYQEVSAESHQVPLNYDFFLFNYHHATMAWLDTKTVRNLPGLKMTLVLETLPNDPFALCPRADFDVYLALDPTMKSDDSRVYAFPRPLEFAPALPEYQEGDIPSIGTFGFATPGKGFELVVDAVNREFDEAVVRLNIPPAAYAADEHTWKIHRRNYAEYLADLCRRVAKPEIRVEVTNSYMEKDDLIRWCARNTLNCFLYNRVQPGLAATTDQAIASGRPLAVSANETFRHIHPYLKPYPRRSLKDAISESLPEVRKMQHAWRPDRFLERFEDVLAERGLLGASGVPEVLTNTRPRILLVNHSARQCGIHQYGLNLSRALAKCESYDFRYAECDSEGDLQASVSGYHPDGILYNHYPSTMPWLTPEITRRHAGLRVGILHETTQEAADAATDELFQAILCPDPTLVERNPLTYRLSRLIPSYINTQPLREIPIIGSFGFGFIDKGYERLVERVQAEFDQAVIFLQMPFNDIVDPEGAYHAKATAERCKARIWKPGVKLAIHHEFLPLDGLLEILGSCHLNAFFYDEGKRAGISSVIEHALAVQRPIAITRCGMFRHVLGATPSICIEDRSLREIMEAGVAPLVPFCNAWSEGAFLADTERVLDRIFQRNPVRTSPPSATSSAPMSTEAVPYSAVGKTLNRILDNSARQLYEPVIQRLFDLAPEMMSRKIPEANVQQGFVFDTVLQLAAHREAPMMLCVGAYEDTASAALKTLGFIVKEIDPSLNVDLETYHRSRKALHGSYDFVFSTSVIEHVKDDEAFVEQIADFLAPDGVAVLTCDYSDQYCPGDVIPGEDFRLYTQRDLRERLLPRMHGCELIDDPQWDCPVPDFTYAGCHYTFATFVVKKKR